MTWRESELSQSDVLARQRRLQAAMRGQKLDALLLYTNHVRSGAVTFATGFTPYWSDALLLLPSEGRAILATALSKRVGQWIKSTNPTAEVLHSPQPGHLIGERLAALGAARLGVVELDRLPDGLADEIVSTYRIELTDASSLFAAVREAPDAAEIGLARKAEAIAVAAFASTPVQASRVGEITEALELKVRNAGAEECYVATAPDLGQDFRLWRAKGSVALGETFAVRLSVAYGGAWIRRTETFSRSGPDDTLIALARSADDLAGSLSLNGGLPSQIEGFAWAEGVTLAGWTIEAPYGTRPLQQLTARTASEAIRGPYGILNLRLQVRTPVLLARPFGISAPNNFARPAA